MGKHFRFYMIIIIFMAAGCYDSDYLEKPGPVSILSKRILIDASHDGGVWWFPQTGNYSPFTTHQGSQLADFLRQKGFTVDELPSYSMITTEMLRKYDKVIRAGRYGPYQLSEIQAYRQYVNRAGTSLLFITEYLRSGEKDALADSLGMHFEGTHYGNVDLFAPHSVTAGAQPFYFNAGSSIRNAAGNPEIEVLAWLSNDPGLPVMGLLKSYPAKILFLGEINGIETVPQPLTENIINWLFQ